MVLSTLGKLYYEYKKENKLLVLFNLIFIITTIVNNVYLPDVYGKLYEMFQNNLDKFMYAFLFILLLKGVVYMIFDFEDYYFNIQKTGIGEKMEEFLINKITDGYIENPDEVIIGEKLSTINKLQKTVSYWYGNFFQYLVPYLFVIVSSVIYMTQIDKYMPFYVLLLILGSSLVIFSNAIFCKRYSYDVNISYAKLYKNIEEYLSNMLAIHTYNQHKTEKENINQNTIEYIEYYKILEKCSLTTRLIGIFLTSCFIFLTMYRAYNLLNTNKINKGKFMSLYFITSTMLNSMIYISDIFSDFTIEYSNLKEIEKIAGINLFNSSSSSSNDNKNDNDNKNKDIIEYPRIKTDSIIKVYELEYKYKTSNTPIIKGFNLEVKRGEIVALVGNIGCGKSTIIKIILGLLKPTKGDVFIEGKNYKTLEQKDIFKRIGYMTQNPVLFNRSIIDNILFSNSDIPRDKIIELLEKFDLNKVFDNLDKGIDSDVGKNGSRLSGGQKQVIWFLRLYLHNPDIILLDEPTASLNEESKEILWKLIQGAIKENGKDIKKTIIMASHDDFLINKATRKVKINFLDKK